MVEMSTDSPRECHVRELRVSLDHRGQCSPKQSKLPKVWRDIIREIGRQQEGFGQREAAQEKDRRWKWSVNTCASTAEAATMCLLSQAGAESGHGSVQELHFFRSCRSVHRLANIVILDHLIFCYRMLRYRFSGYGFKLALRVVHESRKRE